MKIWIVNQYAIPPLQAGGTRHYSLARELISRGHEVTLIASSFDHVTRRETRLSAGQTHAFEIIQGVPFLWLRTPPYPGNTIARMWNMLMFAWRVWREVGMGGLPAPDVIVGSSPHLFGAFAAERVARRRGPFVLEVRDLWPESLIQIAGVSRSHPVVLVFGWIEKYLYRHARQIWTLLPQAIPHMTKKGANERTMLWLPNGVDLSLAPAPDQRADSDEFVVMYTGTLGVLYGLDILLEVAATLSIESLGKRVVVKIVGDGPEKGRLQQLARDKQLTNLEFLPSVPKAKVFEMMQRADCLVAILRNLDLYKHGTSLNKVYDYMASARPVIFAVQSPNNPVSDAGCGVTIPPEDAVAMTGAVRQLLNLPLAERHAMGLRGRNKVEATHDFKSMAEAAEVSLNAARGVKL